MRRALSFAIAALLLSAAAAARVPKATTAQSEAKKSIPPSPQLHATRTSPSDLAVSGELAGVPRGMVRYIQREDLLALPRVTYTVSDDPNFGVSTKVSGISLDDLMVYLRAMPACDMVIAISDDEYRGHYPRAYRAQHHPFLVLEVNGKPPSGWPKDSDEHKYDMGPYMISHPAFTPAYKALSYMEESQIPWGVVRLDFADEKTVYGAIAPGGPHANDPDTQIGYHIAQQNCFRCHNAGSEGGQKAKIPWAALTAVAVNSEQFFGAYVRDPKSRNPAAQMPGNPGYDDATIAALVAYFHAFSLRGKS